MNSAESARYLLDQIGEYHRAETAVREMIAIAVAVEVTREVISATRTRRVAAVATDEMIADKIARMVAAKGGADAE